MTVPRSSLNAPGARKIKITAWRALVWAYADECVRAAGGELNLTNDYSVGSGWSSSIEALSATVRGYLQVHPDAVDIDAVMRSAMFKRDKGGFRDDTHYLLVVRAAEKRTPIASSVDLPARVPMPVLKNTGAQFPKPKVEIHPITRRGWFCPIEWTGYPPAEAETIQAAQLAKYRLFLAALDYLDGMEFNTRRIEGRGLDGLGRVLTPCDESLTKGSTSGALRKEA